MRIIFDVSRRESADAEPFRQKIPYETADEKETVASALVKINEAAVSGCENGGFDEDGNRISPILWESSCLQKKCGACAMVINGRPALACDSFLKSFVKKDKAYITLDPLSKFPVIADLTVDRSIMFENLKTLKVWSDEAVNLKEKRVLDVYDASRCLQCGCCLEVCPNYSPDAGFFGAAGFVPSAGLLISVPKAQREAVKSEYKKHIYEGCGKSLACENICPAKIDINRLLSKSNSIALWRRNG